MVSVRRLTFSLAVLLAGSNAFGAGDLALEPAGNDPADVNSLQRGARNFMNYCAGCHSAKYVRFNSIADDLELSDELMIENLMFNAEKTYETIQNNMAADDSAFLKGFYVDPDSPTGVDNVVLAGTSMPHVLWELQGFQSGVFQPKNSTALFAIPSISWNLSASLCVPPDGLWAHGSWPSWRYSWSLLRC
jgi:ubiquinol-cytochrome c reductase cytochrome c1 subunit